MSATSFIKEWDTLSTTTLDEHKTEDRNAVFNEIPMLKYFESGGRIDRESGGELISYPLLYERNSTLIKMENHYQKLDTSPQEALTRAFYEWREYSISFSISRFERNVNQGNTNKLLDLLGKYKEQARMTMREEFAKDIIQGDGTAGSIHGIDFLLSSTGQVGKIADTVVNNDGDLWWQPFRVTSGVTATNLKNEMRRVLNELRKRDSEPDLILGAQAVHEEYARQLEDKGDFRLKTGGQPKIGFGFKGSELEFSGIPFVWDRFVPDNTIYFLNTRSLGLVFHPDGEFNIGPMVTPSDQHASTAHIYLMAQMVCSNRRDQAVVSGIDLQS